MERTFREQLFVLLLSLSVLKGDCRYIEVSYIPLFFFFPSLEPPINPRFTSLRDLFLKNNEISKDELYSFFNSELKRETPEELMFRRPLRKFDTTAEKTLDQSTTLGKYEISTKLLINFPRST